MNSFDRNNIHTKNIELIGCFSVKTITPSKYESIKDGGNKTVTSELRKNCRFCLTIPLATQIEDHISNQDIANMYKSLTGIEVKH